SDAASPRPRCAGDETVVTWRLLIRRARRRTWGAWSVMRLGHETRRQRRAFAEEELFHLLRDDLLRLFLEGQQAVLVENHLHAFFPHVPGFLRDAWVDT